MLEVIMSLLPSSHHIWMTKGTIGGGVISFLPKYSKWMHQWTQHALMHSLRILPAKVFTMNASVNSTSGYSPHKSVYGHRPRFPLSGVSIDLKTLPKTSMDICKIFSAHWLPFMKICWLTSRLHNFEDCLSAILNLNFDLLNAFFM